MSQRGGGVKDRCPAPQSLVVFTPDRQRADRPPGDLRDLEKKTPAPQNSNSPCLALSSFGHELVGDVGRVVNTQPYGDLQQYEQDQQR